MSNQLQIEIIFPIESVSESLERDRLGFSL